MICLFLLVPMENWSRAGSQGSPHGVLGEPRRVKLRRLLLSCIKMLLIFRDLGRGRGQAFEAVDMLSVSVRLGPLDQSGRGGEYSIVIESMGSRAKTHWIKS